MAEGMGDKDRRTLMLDDIGSHYLYYADAQSHRWASVDIDADGATYRREVDLIDFNPIAELAGSSLYLIFLIDYRHAYSVDPDEYHTLVLRFAE